MNMRRAAVKVLKLIPVWVVGLMGVLLLVEVAYRLSPFDPYRVELEQFINYKGL